MKLILQAIITLSMISSCSTGNEPRSSIKESGGMTSAGDVKFIAVVACDAKGIDPTFPSSVTKVEVSKEATWEGTPYLGDDSLTVILRDKKGKVVAYLMPDDTKLDIVNSLSFGIKLRPYRPGSPDNDVVGSIAVEKETGSLLYDHRAMNRYFELKLTNCQQVVEAR